MVELTTETGVPARAALPIVCDPDQPRLEERPLLAPGEAGRLAGTFKVLANDHRLRLLHALARAGELCVTDLADAVGTSAQAVSNQLQRLVDRQILTARRDGNWVYYRIADPCVLQLLDLGMCLTNSPAAAREGTP
jgi:ArsR family transcriptional regulator, lead/cadmium/zinc/bismuth-responsive transcriptional repressor